MAYLSRTFWQDPRERVKQAPTAVGMPGEAGGTAGSAPQGQAQAPGGEPGAIRSFFEQNKAQGAGILGGLADSINRRIGAASQGITPGTVPGAFSEPEPTYSGGQGMGDLLIAKPRHDAWAQRKAQYEQASQPAIDAQKERAAKDTAGIQPIGQDVQQLGQGQEGIQTMLAKRGGMGGENRLDAWLAGSYAGSNPSALQGVQESWKALQDKAGSMGTVDPYKRSRSLFDWFGARNF